MIVKIVKNKTVVDSNNEFTYVIECYHGDIVSKTSIKIPANEYMLPDETFSTLSNDPLLMRGWLEQLTFQYDDIDIDNYTTIIEEI